MVQLQRSNLYTRQLMSPWDMVAELGIYTEEQIDEMLLCECEEILRQEK